MRSALTLSVLLALAWAGAGMAQSPAYPSPYAPYPGGVPAAIADQHRQAETRLRLQAEANAALARRQQVETRLRLQALESSRAETAYPAPSSRSRDATPYDPRPLATPASPRSPAPTSTQIDDWLDRPR